MYEVVDAEDDNDSPDGVADDADKHARDDASSPFVDGILSLEVCRVPELFVSGCRGARHGDSGGCVWKQRSWPQWLSKLQSWLHHQQAQPRRVRMSVETGRAFFMDVVTRL